MKLTEVLVSIAIFVVASAAFASNFVTVRSTIAKAENISRNANAILETDSFFRKKIREVQVPYWQSLKTHFGAIKEQLEIAGAEKGIEIVSISCVYDKKHKADGIKAEWKRNGKKYVSQEFIKQRIVDVER